MASTATGSRIVELEREVARLQHAVKWLSVDLQNAQADVVAKGREVTALKAQITKQARARVTDVEVQTVFDHWDRHPLRRSGKAVVLGENRKKMIRDRIREQREQKQPIENPVERCCQAIDGLMRKPYVKSSGGRTPNPRGAKRHAMLEHALRDEKTIETCIGYLDEPENVVELRPRRELRDSNPRPLDRAIIALRREFGSDAVFPEFSPGKFHTDAWWSACPLHPAFGHPMRIKERGGRPSRGLELACANGCLPSVLLEAVRALEEKRERALVPVEDALRVVSPEARA